jgi:hypothetical protein
MYVRKIEVTIAIEALNNNLNSANGFNSNKNIFSKKIQKRFDIEHKSSQKRHLTKNMT